MNHTVKIQFFPLIGKAAFIQTGDPDHIPNQTDQSLRFLIDASCKNLHILILHKSVLHDLSKSGNGSQRRFQFMGNIGGKFSSQLFPFYFFGYVHQKNHRTFCLVFSYDRVGDHLDITAIQPKDLVLMISFKNLLHNAPEFLGTIQKIYAFPGSDLVYFKKLPDTGVSGKYHGITVDHKKTFLHVLRNNRELFLLPSGCLKLQTDLTVLAVDLADKRFHLFIHIDLLRMFQIQVVERFHHPAGKSGGKYRRKNKDQKQHAQKRRHQLPDKCKRRVLSAGNTKDIAIFQTYCIVYGLFGKCGRHSLIFALSGKLCLPDFFSVAVIFHAFHISLIIIEDFSTFIHIGDPGIHIIQLIQIICPCCFYSSGNISRFFFQLIHQLVLKGMRKDSNDKCQSQHSNHG